MSSAINIGLSNCTRLPKKLISASLSFCSSAYSSSVSSSCSLACFRQTRSSALFTMATPISVKVNSSSAVGAPKSDQEASSTGVVGANDLLIVGPGVLGRIVAEKWREEHPGSQIYGQTLTTNHHDELVKMGTQLNNKFPYVIFCAPPYPNLDYPGEVRQELMDLVKDSFGNGLNLRDYS